MRVFVLTGVLLGIAACVSDVSNSDAGKPAGTLGGPCLPSNGCDSGLVCVDSTCQKPADAGVCAPGGSLGSSCGAPMKNCLQNGMLGCVGDLGCIGPAARIVGCASALDCPTQRCCLDQSVTSLGGCPEPYNGGTGNFVTACQPSCPGRDLCASNQDCGAGTCRGAIFTGTSVHFGVCRP